MGHGVLSSDQVPTPATLGLEDGGQNYGPPTKGGPNAGRPPEGALHAPLNSTHLSCRSRPGGDAVMLVHPKQVKPLLGVGARPPQTPPRTRSYGSTMLLRLTPTLGHSRMATHRNGSLPWNSWAHCSFASTWWPNRANCRGEFESSPPGGQ